MGYHHQCRRCSWHLHHQTTRRRRRIPAHVLSTNLLSSDVALPIVAAATAGSDSESCHGIFDMLLAREIDWSSCQDHLFFGDVGVGVKSLFLLCVVCASLTVRQVSRQVSR